MGIEITNFSASPDGSFPLILLPIAESSEVEGYNKRLSEAALVAIMRSFRCLVCAGFIEAQKTKEPHSGPNILAAYRDPNDSITLFIRFGCSKSRASHLGKRPCWKPHSLTINSPDISSIL